MASGRTNSLDEIAASVAPPIATRRALGAPRRSRRGMSSGIQSPERNTDRKLCSVVDVSPAAISNMSISAGTEFHTVTPNSATSAFQRNALRRCRSDTATTVAPQLSAPKIS